jgi:argininosuccinate lyase
MPQKKNPDSLELIRGKSARVFGHLTTMLALVKGLPLAYNKDLQEDKEALFDTVDTLSASLRVAETVLRNFDVNVKRAREAAVTDFTGATDLADYLVRKGTQFRKAHEVVGKIVLYAIKQGKELNEVSLDEFKKFSDEIGRDVYEALALDQMLSAKGRTGGRRPCAVIRAARARKI